MRCAKSLLLCCALALVPAAISAQNTVASSVSAIVPRLVNLAGIAMNEQGEPITGTVGLTFSIYSVQAGGAPLWMETQNVQTDAKGNYTVQLGARTTEGLPLSLFTSGEARWLGVRVSGNEEQPRVLLLSVPYALKAADAQTLGGLPASAFVLAAPGGNPSTVSDNSVSNPSSPTSPSVGGSGTQDYIPLWTDNSGDLGNSILFQLGTGLSAKIGINETNPLLTLDVNGSELVRGLFEMATQGFATPTKAFNSQPFNIESSAYNSSTKKYTLNHFQWQGEPTGNNSASTGATLNLLYGTDPASPTETGLSISPNGLFTFAPGQTFPGTGTISGVTAGTDLTGGGSSGNITLNLDTTQVPQLGTRNTFTGNGTFSVSSTDAIDAYTSGPGTTALVGVQRATSGGSYGVYAETFDPSGAGVSGRNFAGSGGTGVYGQGALTGVHGVSGSASPTEAAPAGVWGDTATVNAYGVLGTAEDATAGYFVNDSSDNATLSAFNNAPSNDTAVSFIAGGYGLGQCIIDFRGNLSCSGSKSAVVPVDGGSRKVALYAVEAPENWFEDFGSGQLSKGSARIDLEPTFAQTVNTDLDYHIFLTPRGECEGLYVTNLTPSGFEVRELHHGSSTVAFDYRIIAKRKKYENVRLADITARYKKLAEQQARMQQHRSAAIPTAPHSPAGLGKKVGIAPAN